MLVIPVLRSAPEVLAALIAQVVRPSCFCYITAC